MAIRNSQLKRLNQVYVICSIDDAVDWDKSNKKEYLKTFDEKHLVLITGKEPTRFLCNFELDAKSNSAIEDAMVAGVDSHGRMRPGLGSYSLEIVRRVLKDIKNPDSVSADDRLKFALNGDGTVSDDTLDRLSHLGVISEISSAFTEATKGHILHNRADTKN